MMRSFSKRLRQLTSQMFNFVSTLNLLNLGILLIEHPADILADARDFSFDACEVLSLLLVFQCVACDTIHSVT